MEETQSVDTGITLLDLFNMLFRHIILIAIITVTITALGALYTFQFVQPKYESSALIMVKVEKSEGSGDSTNDYDLTSTLRMIQTTAEFIETNRVLNDVIAKLDLDLTASQVRKNLDIKYSANSLIVTLTYQDESPTMSKLILNTIISSAKTIADEEFSILNNVIDPLDTAENGLYASPNKLLNLIISVLLGGIIGVVTAFLLETLKTTVRSKKELELLLANYQVIGVIPEITNGEEA